MASRKKKYAVIGNVASGATQGANWLAQLKEDTFRDEVLRDLFEKMRRVGDIAGARCVHGRNEHGVDWILRDSSALGDRYIGVQAKSRCITKQGDYQSDSALAVKQQCESAYEHTFSFESTTIRLDGVELWTSAHITQDAEGEFNAPLSRRPVRVKKGEAIYRLIEQYCPSIVRQIPGLALSGALYREANPPPLSVRLLGCQLNPKEHFIEPTFSENPHVSPPRMLQKGTAPVKLQKPLHLDDLLRSDKHLAVVGPELSGKSYLLRRIAYVLSARGVLPIRVEVRDVTSDAGTTAPQLLNKYIDWLSLRELSTASLVPCQIAILIDDHDRFPKAFLKQLVDTSHEKIIVISTGRTPFPVDKVRTYYLSGVNVGSIDGFLRSLDIDHTRAVAIAERASTFLKRTLATSGLPATPFTISAMLAECSVSRKRLATPTMGRLVERFVDDQIGSHEERSRTDFETKKHFLTDIGGHNAKCFRKQDLERLVARFLADHDHPHTKDDFLADLVESGILTWDEDAAEFRWTHHIFREFYWIRNLVREKALVPIAKLLTKRSATSVAAVAGSQMGDSHDLLVQMLTELGRPDWMNGKFSCDPANVDLAVEALLPSDEEEASLLDSIETDAKSPSKDNARLTRTERGEISFTGKAADALARTAAQIASEKHYIVQNLSALLVNSRGLSAEDKRKVVACVLRSNRTMGRHIETLARELVEDPPVLLIQLFIRYWQFAMNDLMVGDHFLVKTFTGLSKLAEDWEDRLAAEELLVSCCEHDPERLVAFLAEHRRIDAVVAVYSRLIAMYYFRFHRTEDKRKIKAAMKDLRKLAGGFRLPKVG